MNPAKNSKAGKNIGPKAKISDPSRSWLDLAETNNLWHKHPEIVKRLTDLLERYKRQGHSRTQSL